MADEKLFKVYENYFIQKYLPTLKSPDYHSIVDVMYLDVFLESSIPLKTDSKYIDELNKMLTALQTHSMSDSNLQTILSKITKYSIIPYNKEWSLCNNVVVEVLRGNRTMNKIMDYLEIRQEVLQVYHQYKFLEVIKDI